MGCSYRDLVAWQKGMELVNAIYQATRTFPREELYGLAAQLRRAAVSVPSNIAEGQARYSSREFRHFLNLAKGSLVGIETQLVIATKLGFMGKEKSQEFLDATDRLGRILTRLMASIRQAASVSAIRRGVSVQ